MSDIIKDSIGQEQVKKYDSIVKTADEFVNSPAFARLNNEFEEPEEHLDWARSHPEEFGKENVLIGDVAWSKEIIEGTTRRGLVIRDFYALYDIVDHCGENTQSVYGRFWGDPSNILDFYDMYPDEHRKVIEDIKKEYAEYKKAVKKFDQYVEVVGGGDIVKQFVDVAIQQTLSENKYNSEQLNLLRQLKRFLDEKNRSKMRLNSVNVEIFIKELNKLNISEESLTNTQERMRKRTAMREQQERNRATKKRRREWMEFLQDRKNNAKRFENMQIAANSMEDKSVKESLASLGKLNDEQLNELVKLTKRVEELNRQLDDLWIGIDSFVRDNAWRVRQKYGMNFELNNPTSYTIEELEIFVKVCKAVNEVAKEYGLDTVAEIKKQDDDIWEDDVFFRVDEMKV